MAALSGPAADFHDPSARGTWPHGETAQLGAESGPVQLPTDPTGPAPRRETARERKWGRLTDSSVTLKYLNETGETRAKGQSAFKSYVYATDVLHCHNE